MFLPPVKASALRLASTYKVYLRWHTHRLRPLPALAALSFAEAQAMAEPAGIRILELSADETNVLMLVSLLPTEPVSICASKLKGCLSKWLRERSGLSEAEHLLGRGYFACTSGHNTREDVIGYLDKQPAHHGYARRVLPPVFGKEWEPAPADEARLNPAHAVALLQFHIVLAVANRHGVFGDESGPVVAEDWRRLQESLRFHLLKVSFVPDHIHLAVRTHPAAVPAELVATLMQSAQERMLRDFPEHLIQAELARLWPDGAYVGGYGDITAGKVRGYMRKWEAGQGL
jgi:REP element-mobilizing transposase RayT